MSESSNSISATLERLQLSPNQLLGLLASAVSDGETIFDRADPDEVLDLVLRCHNDGECIVCCVPLSECVSGSDANHAAVLSTIVSDPISASVVPVVHSTEGYLRQVS